MVTFEIGNVVRIKTTASLEFVDELTPGMIGTVQGHDWVSPDCVWVDFGDSINECDPEWLELV